MRVARVETNRTCNQNCAFCRARRPADERAFIVTSAVRARITDAVAVAGDEIVLTGGEPTLRRDLPALVAHAKALGARRVVIETNGALVDASLARALAAAGLDVARVHLPAWGAALDAITRDPGGADATARALLALHEAGVRLEISAPVLRDNVDTIASLPDALAASGVPVDALVLGVPTEAPDRSTLVPLAEATRAIERVEEAARRAGITVRMSADASIPPCLFDRPARVAHLFSLTPGGAERADHVHPPACEACRVRDRCPGVPASAASTAVRPIGEDRVRRRLSVISTIDEQIARELYQEDLYRRDGGEIVPARIVRVRFQCNQACEFCFVSTHLPAPSASAVHDAIVDIARRGGIVVLSGGEPTLDPRLEEWVRLARAEGAVEVELQTNAIRLADDGRARALAAAGLDQAFVSLHGSRAEVGDAVTSAPGTWERTVRGIDALVAAGVRTRLNFVFCEKNREDFPRVVELVAERWPGAVLVVSFVAPSTDVVPRTPELVPRYTDVMPSLVRGLERARELGVAIDGFESMCGIPLCLVPGEIAKEWSRLAAIPEGFDRGEMADAEACRACALRTRCFGLRRGYAELHGTSELRPVQIGSTPAR